MDTSSVHIRNRLVLFTSLHFFPKAPVGSWKRFTRFCLSGFLLTLDSKTARSAERWKSCEPHPVSSETILLPMLVTHFQEGTVGAIWKIEISLKLLNSGILCLLFLSILSITLPNKGRCKRNCPINQNQK